ncbi:hypothetical protein M8J75_007625 [Diaphorina citri]|nr:hypothetical protein M8J75_007625 [Diaphorina citri]
MKTSKIKIAKQPKMVKVAKANQEKVVKVAKASQTGTPQATKCPNCEVFSNYTRKFIGNIVNIMKHLTLQHASEVVKAFPKLPQLLTSSQTDVTGHWLNLIQQDLDFLEKYSTKVKRTDTEEKRMELLERKYKRKMKAVVLERIAPNLLVCVKNQNELKDLLEKTLKTKVDNLKRNEKKYQELMKVKFEVKMTSMKQRLATVMDIVKNTEHALMRMETAYDLVKAKCAEHEDKYETQVKQTETITTEYNNISKENENLKTQLAQKQEDVRALEKTLREIKEENGNVADKIKELKGKLKTTMKMTYNLTKLLNTERESKEGLLKMKEQFTQERNVERAKTLALEEMNTRLKEKLNCNAANMKEELARRFDCELSDGDDITASLSEININDYPNIAIAPNPTRSTVTGNPYADIKHQIVANYKLIKRLEEEILALNELRVKIKVKNKVDLTKPD